MEAIDDPRKVSLLLSRNQALVAGKIEEKGHHGGGVRYLAKQKPPATSVQEEQAEEEPSSTEKHLIDVVV